MRRIRTPWLIHGFAALHAAVTVVCTLAGIPDSLLLTALTMLLTVLICQRRGLTVEFTAICVILVNIHGYALGKMGAEAINFPSELLNHALATFLTTELLGWALDLFAKAYRSPEGQRTSWKDNLGWLVFAVIVVFALRIFIELFVFRKGPFQGVDVLREFRFFVGDSLVMLLLFIATLLFVRSGHNRHYSLDSWSTVCLPALDSLYLYGRSRGWQYGIHVSF